MLYQQSAERASDLFVGIFRFDDVVVGGYGENFASSPITYTVGSYIYRVMAASPLGYGWLASINVANRTLHAASQGTTHLPQGWLTCIQQRRQNQRKITAAEFFLFTQKLFCFAFYLLCPEPRARVDMHEEEWDGAKDSVVHTLDLGLARARNLL